MRSSKITRVDTTSLSYPPAGCDSAPTRYQTQPGHHRIGAGVERTEDAHIVYSPTFIYPWTLIHPRGPRNGLDNIIIITYIHTQHTAPTRISCNYGAATCWARRSDYWS